jgi:hypothetical protein
MLLAGQAFWLPEVTEAAVTDLKLAVNGFVLVSLKLTVPLRPGNRSFEAVAALIVTLTAVPVETEPVPDPVVWK